MEPPENFTILGWSPAQWDKAYEFWNLCHKPYEWRASAFHSAAAEIVYGKGSTRLHELSEVAKFWHERLGGDPLGFKNPL